MSTDLENAYFAGILDGEGTIALKRSHDTLHRKHTHYYPGVMITNTHKGVCDLAKEIYGGCVYERKSWRHTGYKPCFQWLIGSRMADSFLRLVLPYLIIKKDQAELVLTFYEGIFTNGRQPTDEEIKRRDELCERLKELNRR